MKPGSGNARSPLDCLLTSDVPKVKIVRIEPCRLLRSGDPRRKRPVPQKFHDLRKPVESEDLQVGDNTSFSLIFFGHDQYGDSHLPGFQGNRQDSRHRHQFSAEAQFAHRHNISDRIRGNLLHAGGKPQRYGKIKVRSAFQNIRRGKIDRDSLRRHPESDILQGCADAVACFAHLSRDIAHHCELREPVADVCLDGDGNDVYSDNCR